MPTSPLPDSLILCRRLSGVRNNLIKTVQSITDLPQQQKIKPPVIPPAPKLSAAASIPLAPGFAPPSADSDIALVMRVITEERMSGSSRLQLILSNEKHNNKAPNIKLKPGMRIRIIVMPSYRATKGGDNAKK